MSNILLQYPKNQKVGPNWHAKIVCVELLRTILVSSCGLKKVTITVAFHFMNRRLKNVTIVVTFHFMKRQLKVKSKHEMADHTTM